jgi:hypothetical protein
MKIPEHLALSLLLAQFDVRQEFGAAGTALMVAAGMLPDLDGMTILGGWLTGNWASQAAPIWRWLTGDFIT